MSPDAFDWAQQTGSTDMLCCSAVRKLRRKSSFESSIRGILLHGGDTDTNAGGCLRDNLRNCLAGRTYGMMCLWTLWNAACNQQQPCCMLTPRATRLCSHSGRHDWRAARCARHSRGLAHSGAEQHWLQGRRCRRPAARVAGACAGPMPGKTACCAGTALSKDSTRVCRALSTDGHSIRMADIRWGIAAACTDCERQQRHRQCAHCAHVSMLQLAAVLADRPDFLLARLSGTWQCKVAQGPERHANTKMAWTLILDAMRDSADASKWSHANAVTSRRTISSKCKSTGLCTCLGDAYTHVRWQVRITQYIGCTCSGCQAFNNAPAATSPESLGSLSEPAAVTSAPDTAAAQQVNS